MYVLIAHTGLRWALGPAEQPRRSRHLGPSARKTRERRGSQRDLAAVPRAGRPPLERWRHTFRSIFPTRTLDGDRFLLGAPAIGRTQKDSGHWAPAIWRNHRALTAGGLPQDACCRKAPMGTRELEPRASGLGRWRLGRRGSSGAGGPGVGGRKKRGTAHAVPLLASLSCGRPNRTALKPNAVCGAGPAASKPTSRGRTPRAGAASSRTRG